MALSQDRRRITTNSNSAQYTQLNEFYDDGSDIDDEPLVGSKRTFQWTEYFAFFAVGLSMMWTWYNGPLSTTAKMLSMSGVLTGLQASNLVVFAIAILSMTILLQMVHTSYSYASRLKLALTAYLVVGSLLTSSTLSIFYVSAISYYLFLQIIVFITAAANGVSQNSAFAFAAGFGRSEYAPAIMTGEALAALLPSVIEITTALLFPDDYFEVADTSASQRSSKAFTCYFATSILIALISLGSLNFLQRQRSSEAYDLFDSSSKTSKPHARWQKLWKSLKWPALANFACLCISSISPVFAARITSTTTTTAPNGPVLLRPDAFVPMAIVLWNIGDLLGSLVSVTSTFLVQRPLWIFVLSMGRLLFIPLYLMCNIDERGSVFGDWYYLVVVQFLFGLSHGWLSSVSMMGVSTWVEEEEREDGGAFMGMVLVGGLVGGSLLGVVAARL